MTLRVCILIGAAVLMVVWLLALDWAGCLR